MATRRCLPPFGAACPFSVNEAELLCMAATTPRLQTKPDSGPRPGPGTRPRPGTGPRPPRRTVPVRLIGPWENFVEGAAAALCAVVAMAAASALALTLLDAGSAGSVWSLAMALTAMAVGGSVGAGF